MFSGPESFCAKGSSVIQTSFRIMICTLSDPAAVLGVKHQELYVVTLEHQFLKIE